MYSDNETNIHINYQTDARIFVPAAAAILLTFGRSGMMPFEDIYTVFDQAMNIFVVITAFVVGAVILPRILYENFRHILPILMLSVWVSVRVIFGSPSQYWPSQTALITIGSSILICSQISRVELRYVRYFVLLLAGVFSLYVLIYAQDTLSIIIMGTLTTQLGLDLSPANVIIFPRIMYMIVITCIATLIIEKSKWLSIAAALLMVIPIIIALATGNRGSLVALVVAAFTFILSLRKKREVIFAALAIVLLLIIGYTIIIQFFPIMEERLISGGSDTSSSERYDLWREALEIDNISLFGRGAGTEYPHNIFIEFYLNYGIVGLALFLVVLFTSANAAWKCYSNTHDREVLWVICLITLQMVAQQFSLDIFYGSLWAALVLPLGLSWNRPPNIKLFTKLLSKNVLK
jgi:O-antigen ligase